jgi:hypothetical protein
MENKSDFVNFGGHMIKKSFLLIFIALLVGCAYLGSEIQINNVNLENTEPNSTSNVTYIYNILRNYKIGETKVSYIGSAMLKVRSSIDSITEKITYVEQRNKSTNSQKTDPLLTKSSEDFDVISLFQTRKSLINKKPTTINFRKTDHFSIDGTIKNNGKMFYVISNQNTVYRFLMDEDNNFVNGQFIDEWGYLFFDDSMKTKPMKIKFIEKPFYNRVNYKKHIEKLETSDVRLTNIPYINYELIYGGKDLTGLHIVYREYTNEGIARQAFYQNLNYERNAKTIRFKDTVIEVISADNQKINFRVLEDDIAMLKSAGTATLPNNQK